MTIGSAFTARADHRPALSVIAALVGLALFSEPASAASPIPPPRVAPPAINPHGPTESPATTHAPLQEQDNASRGTAARARTNECGHQWNNMKRAGTAAGTTWKEFFRGCQMPK